MRSIPCRLAAAAVTVAALGAGAAPALVAAKTPPIKAKTPLVVAIQRDTPLVRVRFSIGHGQFGHYSIPLLGQDAHACDDSAYAVARIQADRAQRPAQQLWVTGVRLQQAGDHQLGRGEHEEVYGHIAAGNAKMQAGIATLRRADDDIGHADALLGVHHSGPSAARAETNTL